MVSPIVMNEFWKFRLSVWVDAPVNWHGPVVGSSLAIEVFSCWFVISFALTMRIFRIEHRNISCILMYIVCKTIQGWISRQLIVIYLMRSIDIHEKQGGSRYQSGVLNELRSWKMYLRCIDFPLRYAQDIHSVSQRYSLVVHDPLSRRGANWQSTRSPTRKLPKGL